MRKVCLAALLVFMAGSAVAQQTTAQAASDMMGLGMPGALAGEVSTILDGKADASGHTLIESQSGKKIKLYPNGNTKTGLNLEASGDDGTTITFGDGSTTRQHLTIKGASSEGADDGYILMCAAGSIWRGGCIVMYGNDSPNDAGYLKLDAGGRADAKVVIITIEDATQLPRYRWYWSYDSGDMQNTSDYGGNLVFNKEGTGIREYGDEKAAAGANQTQATEIVSFVTYVTGADGAKGVKLPVTPGIGSRFTVYNTANAALLVYPGSGNAINAAGMDNSVSVAAYGTLICNAKTWDQWWCTEGANP